MTASTQRSRHCPERGTSFPMSTRADVEALPGFQRWVSFGEAAPPP
jgi:hypothetical protein